MDPVSVNQKEWTSFFDELKGESDRAASILVAAYIDSLLRAKLETVFCKGNAETRRKLFDDSNGAFSSFSAKVDAAFCLGWLEPDLFHDLRIIRKIRNSFAHQIHGLSFESEEIKKLIDKFKVPHQLFYDWGKIKCGTLRPSEGVGVVVFSGEPGPDVENVSEFPAKITFAFGTSWILAFLVRNLDLNFHDDEGNPLKARFVIEPEE